MMGMEYQSFRDTYLGFILHMMMTRHYRSYSLERAEVCESLYIPSWLLKAVNRVELAEYDVGASGESSNKVEVANCRIGKRSSCHVTCPGASPHWRLSRGVCCFRRAPFGLYSLRSQALPPTRRLYFALFPYRYSCSLLNPASPPRSLSLT